MSRKSYPGGTISGRKSDADLQQLVQSTLHIEVVGKPKGVIVRQKPRGSRRYRRYGAGLAASEDHDDTMAGRLSIHDLHPELRRSF